MDAKRVRGGLLAAGAAFVAVLVVALLLFFVSGDEADLSYRSVDFDAQLQSNGDIRFTEHLDYQLKRRENDDGDTKPWKQLYLTFKLRNQDLTNITDISVTNASTGEQYTQIAPQLPSDVSDSEWESEYAGHGTSPTPQSAPTIRNHSTLPPAGLTPTVRTMTNKSKSAGTFPPPSNRAVSNST